MSGNNMAASRGDNKRRRGKPRARLGRFRVARFEIGEVEDARLVPAGGDKAQQIGGSDRRGAVVGERVIVGKRSVKTPGQAAARSGSAGFQCQGSKPAIWRAG
jgi:hypothetical protein